MPIRQEKKTLENVNNSLKAMWSGHADCLYDMIEYSPGDKVLSTVNAKSPQRCQKICAKTDGCEFFVFRQAKLQRSMKLRARGTLYLIGRVYTATIFLYV